MMWPTGRRTAIALSVALIAVFVYGSLWLGWRQGWCWLQTVDMSMLDAAHDVGVKHEGWLRFWREVSVVFDPTVIRLAGVVAVVVALVRRQLRAALFLVVGTQLCDQLIHLSKGLAGRERPTAALVHVHGLSFPSGHALAATIGVLVFLTVLLPVLGATARAVAITAGTLIVVAVGVARVALTVHYPSDVLAGWALGYLYVLMCAALVRPPGLSGPDRLADRRASGRRPRYDG